MTQVTDTVQNNEIPACLPEQPPAYDDVGRQSRPIPWILSAVGPKPFVTTCPSCNQEILTKTEKRTTVMTHITSLLLFMLECYCCVCLPYCLGTFKNTEHTCPQCSQYLGTYRV